MYFTFDFMLYPLAPRLDDLTLLSQRRNKMLARYPAVALCIKRYDGCMKPQFPTGGSTLCARVRLTFAPYRNGDKLRIGWL
jgi:hypothetical protein